MKNFFNTIACRAGSALLLCAWLLGSGLADAATYAYRNDVFAYDTPSGSAPAVAWHATSASPACTAYPLGDDDWADVAFPAGFTFTFGGTNYTGVRVYSNGILAFPPDTSGFHRDYTPQALPAPAGPTYTGCTTSAPVNVMLPYWIDIVAGTANGTTGASVQYELLGTAPNRRFVISWVNVKLYNTTTRYNFQVALYESATGVNGNFRYQYTTGSSTGTSSTVGVQLSATDYTQYSYNQVFIDTTNGTAILWYPANQLATKAAEYRFDESVWSGAAGEVKDTSGNSQNASRIGVAANVVNGKLCRGGSFTSNTSNAIIDAVATPIVPGNQGSVDFWYRSTNSWTTADTMLFDASTVANRPFFLMKRSTGALRFVVTDSAGTSVTANSPTQSFAAGTWVHVGVSWSVRVGTNQTALQIFINGVLQNGAPTRGTTNGAMPALSSIYIGDNRTSGVTPTNGTPNGANGIIDEVYVYPIEISAPQAEADMNLTRPVCTALDHFHIIHGGSIVNCNTPANVTFEAHDVNHALFSLAGTTMTISNNQNHGSWSVVSAINPVVNTTPGTATYTFSNESSVILGLSNPFVEAVNIDVASGAITELTGAAAACVPADYTFGTVCDANLNFVDSGFLFDVPHHVAETSQTVTVSAVKKIDNSLACTPAFASVSKSLTFSCAYVNPATGTLPVRVGGTALNAAGSVATACDVGGKAVTLNFNASGVATTTVQYADVGNMTLNATHTTAGGVVMTGTDSFIAAPASFAFSSITAAPIKAGANFSATVTARNAAATPAATPNFGKESTTPEGVTLTFAKCQPTGTNAVNGVFTGSVGSFSNGAASASNLVWSEVGNIDLIATLASGSYLGSGLSATGNTGSTGSTCSGSGGAGTVGRFIPHHFDTLVTQGCNVGGFTYSAQPFFVTVTAKNGLVSPTTTLNYDGTVNTSPNFAKAVTLSDANGATVGALSNTAVAASLFAQGVAATPSPPTTSSPIYTFTSKTAPTEIKLRAVETTPGGDGVSSSGFTEGTTTVRSGRGRLLNAYGSELLDLPMAFRTEFWNGTGWTLNSADVCTGEASLGAANAVSLSLTAVTPASWTTCAWDSIVAPSNLSGIGCATAAPAGRKYKEGATPSIGFTGDFNLWLKAPGAGKAGSGLVTPTVPAWLGVVPPARATFGIYKSPVIYMRENY